MSTRCRNCSNVLTYPFVLGFDDVAFFVVLVIRTDVLPKALEEAFATFDVLGGLPTEAYALERFVSHQFRTHLSASDP